MSTIWLTTPLKRLHRSRLDPGGTTAHMVEEEVTDGERIATLLTGELENRTSGGYGRLAVESHETETIVHDRQRDTVIGRYRPAPDGGLTVVFETDPESDRFHLKRAADLKTVADRFAAEAG